MAQPIIEVEGLSKCYKLGAIGATSLREEWSTWWDRRRGKADVSQRDFWALRDVSFSVQKGEVLGVIGSNGAGKSTLFKILSRITEPTSGRAVLRGRVASLLEVGTGFHPDLSGRENIFLNGAILGMTRVEIRRKFDEIVAFAEVERFIDTPVKRYSSGMYVRLAFAVAAHLEPEILIVDEVLAVGDAAFQKKCLGKMQNVTRNDGRTVLFVSHNIDAVVQLCTSCVLLKQGRVFSAGRTDQVVSRYMTEGGGQANYVAPAEKTHGILEVISQTPDGTHRELSFDIRFATADALENPTLGAVIYTLGGTPVFGSNTLFHSWQKQPGKVATGRGRITIRDIPLWSDTYKASFWLSDGHHSVDSVEDEVVFKVLNPTLPVNAPSGRLIGAVHLPAEWRFDP